MYFGHTNISNCIKLHIFAQFVSLNLYEYVYIYKYEHHILYFILKT